jgi:hypothetical protein
MWTYEIAIPLWKNWVTMTEKEALVAGHTIYVYGIMESDLASANGTDMTFNGNPGFAFEEGFKFAAELHLAPLAGDANKDGKVDVSDLGILAANYGLVAGATWTMGDFNQDGKVDVSDLGILAANYGVGTGASLDFTADAKALGLAGDAKAEPPAASNLACGSAGLPLIAGLMLSALFLSNWMIRKF